tara:strand:- start:2395 stop:2925 length:531 start_codon:yes stop_codon:yes gene_type:complete
MLRLRGPVAENPAMNELVIRPAKASDAEQIAQILQPVLQAGGTYALPRDWSSDETIAYWLAADKNSLVATLNDEIVGTYYLKTNQMGGGSHVCNCGYVVAQQSGGKGIAAAMCRHSLRLAREMGYQAMQFNFVVSTNEHAIRLWRRLGFGEVGRLPGAFQHPELGQVDALVMYQRL